MNISGTGPWIIEWTPPGRWMLRHHPSCRSGARSFIPYVGSATSWPATASYSKKPTPPPLVVGHYGIERRRGVALGSRSTAREHCVSSMRTIGQVDIPLDPSKGMEDRLEIIGYYKGLARFIAGCQTPMTIAVQGDWGSGKTTALNFIKHELSRDSATVVEFNTWQYSQFDLGSTLIFSMVHEVMAPLVGKSDKARQYLRSAGRIARDVAAAAAKHAGNAAGVGFATDAIIDSLENTAEGSGESNLAARIKKLREEFAETIEDYCKETGKDRVVVIIDDLDRVDPERAVEVMEALKVFFDCQKCVFVLAIDFEVVARGVSRKYGDDFDAAKARSFFDKIIQVPFRMPVDQFEIGSLLSEALLNMGVRGYGAEPGYDRYVAAALTSIGRNPRSMKRLVNTFELLKIILDGQNASKPNQKIDELVVFMLLCAQVSYPDFHKEVARSIALKSGQIVKMLEMAKQWDSEDKTEGDDEEPAEAGGTAEDDEIVEGRSAKRGMDPAEAARVAVNKKPFADLNSAERAERFGVSETDREPFDRFLQDLSRALSEASGTGEVDGEVLRTHVHLAAITSVGSSAGTGDDAGGMTATTEDRDARIVQNAGEGTLRLLREFEVTLRGQVGGRPICSSAQSASVISFYAAESTEGVLKMGPRVRPRILGVSYSTKGLRLQFGRAVKKGAVEGKRYGTEWSALAQKLEDAFGAHGHEGGNLLFREMENSGAPFTIDGIGSSRDIQKVSRFLPYLYDMAIPRRVTD